MDLQLTDKMFLVTASSRGLGFSVAQALIAEGAHVILCGRNENSLKQAVSRLGSRSEYIIADVSKKDDITYLFDQIRSSKKRLDGLFANAGGPPPGTFASISEDDWYIAFELTLMSSVRLTQSILPLLKQSDSPVILYNTSISVKQPIDNLLLSNSLRSAVIGMMRTIANELGPYGIRINAVCPGYIYTQRVEQLMAQTSPSQKEQIEEMIPLKRMGFPEEFGPVCAFLLSPRANYIHGTLLLIDGGLYRGMM